MKNKKGYKLLGIAILFFGVILFSFLLILLFAKQPTDNTEELALTSEYIAQESKDPTAEILPQQIPEGLEVNPVKQGEIKEDENRKVITFKNELSEAVEQNLLLFPLLFLQVLLYLVLEAALVWRLL